MDVNPDIHSFPSRPQDGCSAILSRPVATMVVLEALGKCGGHGDVDQGGLLLPLELANFTAENSPALTMYAGVSELLYCAERHGADDLCQNNGRF